MAMITEEILELLGARPFMPFMIHTADGGALRVATRNDAAVLRPVERVFVFEREGVYEILAPHNIARITVEVPISGGPMRVAEESAAAG